MTNTFTVVSGNNWSTVANWDQGHVPTSGEDVVISGAITWDVANVPKIPATGALGSITSSGAYGISVDISDAACHTSGACAVSFTTATANTETLFTITGTATHFVTFNGTTITASAGTANKYGIYHNSDGGTVLVNSALVGGGGSSTQALRINASNALATVSGNITGGSGSSAGGVYTAVNTSIITVASGTITGGSAATCPGISNVSGTPGAIVVSAGVKLVNSTQASAIYGSFTWNAGADDYWTIAGTVTRVAKEVAATDLKSGVKNGTVTGTLSSGGGGAWGF